MCLLSSKWAFLCLQVYIFLLFGTPVLCGKASCSLKYTKSSEISGKIIHLKAIHPQIAPTLTIVKEDEDGNHVESWWIYNVQEYEYQFLTIIRPAEPPVYIEAIEEMDREGEYHYFVTLNSVDGKPAMESSLIPVEPTHKNFHLTEEYGKLGKAVIVIETQKPNEELGLEMKAAIKQFVHADEFGGLVAYYIITETGAKKHCVLFSMVDDRYAKAFIACFPTKGTSKNDDTMHHVQTIPLYQLPLLTAVQLTNEKKPLVIIADSADKYYGANKDESAVVLNVIKVYTHLGKGSKLVKKQEILIDEIISIDSIETYYNQVFLAVATPVDVLIYKYNEKTYQFALIKQIRITDVIQVKFQELLSYKDLLYILTSKYENNIRVYSLKEGKNWVAECKISSPGSKFLEVTSFEYKNVKADQLISITRSPESGYEDDASSGSPGPKDEADVYDITAY